MPRQLWETGQPTSVDDLNLAMRQTCRIYTTMTEAEADNPTPSEGQVRIITGLDLPTRQRPVSSFMIQVFTGTWQNAISDLTVS